MANKVFANGREIACKAANGKSVAALPDVCFTPPTAPPTPPGVPLPYPNNAFAKDTSNGTKKVKISRKEVVRKDKSFLKTSTGDEAGSAPKKGMLSSTNKGKVYFISGSPDVKVEGQEVVRHLDISTHNHMSQQPANEGIPWPYLDTMALAKGDVCTGEATEVNNNCSSSPQDDNSPACCEARKCMLVPFSPNKCCSKSGKKMTPHHLVPSADFVPHSERGKAAQPGKYNSAKAPCMCLEGADHNERTYPIGRLKEHGRVGRAFSRLRRTFLKKGGNYNLGNACKLGAKAARAVRPECTEACLEHQLQAGHNDMNMGTRLTDPMPRLSRQVAPKLFNPKIH